MGDALDGKIPYDKDAFAIQAARVAALTPMLPEGFPERSYIAGKTAAKPEIWKNRAEFDELLKKLAAKSAALAEVAKGGELAKVGPAFNDHPGLQELPRQVPSQGRLRSPYSSSEAAGAVRMSQTSSAASAATMRSASAGRCRPMPAAAPTPCW
jgi:hypothetical protein